MKLEILVPVLVISGIGLGLGIFLTEFLKTREGKYDERQLVERGRAANLAMNVAYAYLLGLFMGLGFELIQTAYLPIVAVYGLVMTMIVYHGYCIFHDAYLVREEDWGKHLLRTFTFGGLWLALVLRGDRWRGDQILIDGAFALAYLSEFAMLLLRGLVLYLRERSAEKDECDG